MSRKPFPEQSSLTPALTFFPAHPYYFSCRRQSAFRHFQKFKAGVIANQQPPQVTT